MRIIIFMNLAGIDLNLMLVFDAIMSEHHVTRASQKIGMSQPAMSNALNRLRHHLKDDLFVRGPDGMRPTPRAMELAAPIRSALEGLEVALDPVSFVPAMARRTFKIGTSDYTVATLLPAIARTIESDAPGISVCIVPSAGRTLEMLDAQDIDFGIGAFDGIPERFESARLLDDNYVLIMRKGNPLAKGRLSLAKYAAARHMLMSPRGDPSGFVDKELQAQGLSRQVAITVNSFSAAPALLASTDLILAAPQRIARIFAPAYDLVTRKAPFTGPREYSTATLVWHQRLANHPAHIWFRDLVIGIAGEASI